MTQSPDDMKNVFLILLDHIPGQTAHYFEKWFKKIKKIKFCNS